MHTNMCEPFNVHARGGCEYFIMFMVDYSRFICVYLMHKQFDALKKFIEFKAKSKNQLDKCVNAFRSDRGKEYMST